MPCRCLCTLDVLRNIVDVGEDRRAEASGLDGFGKTRLLLDAGTHSPDLNVGQWLLPTQHKVVWECRQQVLFNLRHKEKSTEKVDGAVALVMALDRVMKDQNAGSVYDDRGLLVL